MDAYDGSNKVIRAQTLRRGKNDERLSDRIKLKKVLGLTVYSNAALDVSPTTGILAYPAGCTVVLFNAKKLSQSYLLNTTRKAITAVAYSKCGRYIATGECGINPAIKVWELDSQYAGGNSNANSNIHNNHNSNIPTTGDTNNAGGTVVAEFLGHKYAVSCVAFSPTGKYLVSVGSQHDMIVNVFDWKLNLKIASNKVSAKVAAVCFSEDGNYFVTVGNRHVKYWYLEGGRKYKEPIPLMGRSAILGELRNNDFCAVACGKGDCSESTYAITRVGHLVEFNSRRLLDKWVACRTTSANCICVNTNYILVGCAEAIVRIFNSATLEYITTLPRTHYLGVDVAQGIHINHIMTVPPNAKYPDTIAMVYDEGRSKVTCIYNDHSLYVWDLRDVKRVGKSHSFLYHSACIWGVETVPYNFEMNNIQHQQQQRTLPEDCFVTCSSDDTIRVWGLEDCENNEVYRKNIYSKDLLKVVYIDDELNYIKDVDNPIVGNDKSSSYDGRNGVRCIKINPDKSHLASGDRSGNIRIYNLNSLKLITMIEAHDSEVLCLEYTNEKIEKKLLASASRDRLIHVFDVNQGYKILQTLDDHSSSITSVKFIGSGINFQMISCGADKSIMFRQFQNSQFQRGTNCSGKATLYDMEVDSNSKHILTACQDRNIRVYGTQNAKHTKTFKGSHSDDGSLIKLCLDFSGIYVATSCTDKTLSVYDYYSNECMARMYGHSELVTGLKFTNDCKYLISASGDGCIFIWQIPHDMIVTMQARLSQQRMRSGHPPLPRPISNPVADVVIGNLTRAKTPEKLGTSPSQLFTEDITLTPGCKLSEVGQLPQWAKRKTSDDVTSASMPHISNSGSISVPPAVNLSSSPNQNQMIMPKPRGRWAQRGQIDSDILDLRSTSESPQSTAYNAQTSDYNSGSSKDIYNQAYLSEDSSIDSGLENRRDLFISKLVPEQKKISNLRFEANNDNDGDVEDISDGERTSSDHGMVFYPIPVPGTPTDFKVNAMNEEELRKSVRRQKFEKSGLHLTVAAISHGGASTGTGTGTSDTEDEGSTPSGENAERSLASTLGGSSDNIPQQSSSSFLQAALDGPGQLPERNDKSRRSISAKHNTESKTITATPKSYTNRKKEELMKVISEAKQKLENVGYRSPLRGSQSISDLSYMGGSPDNGRSRFQRTDDFSGISYYNSMESILSDESDCKSAPLEILFNKTKKDKNCLTTTGKSGEDGNYAFEKVECTSKSYGSSPNTTSNFDFYMQQNRMSRDPHQFDITGYSLDEFYDIAARGKPATRVSNLPTSVTYPKFFPHVTDFSLAEDSYNPDDIPTLSYKNAQYTSTVSKSLSREFANQRQVNNSNPLYIKVDELNSTKPISKPAGKPAIPAKPAFLQQNEDSQGLPGSCSSFLMRKSCSFEVNMIDTSSSHTTQHQSHLINAHKGIVGKRFERNLEMFEKDQEKRHEVCQKVSAPTTTTMAAAKSTLEMNYVPHKPPVAARRTASMRLRNRAQNKERYNTVDQIQYTPIEMEPIDVVSSCISSTSDCQRDFVNKDFLAKQELKKTSNNVPKASEEKSYEIYISETASNDNDNMDSLELYTKPSLRKDNSIDSLDEPTNDKHKKNSQNELSSQLNLKDTSLGVLSSEIECKFRDIEKKINIVNKLIELEEKKLEQERMQKELRMKPFECDSNQKGYVKCLTLNFDKLAERNIEENLEYARSLRHLSNSETSKMKRNYSLPDVLEGAKFQVFDTITLDGNGFTDAESEKIKDDFAEKDQGNPKSFMSVHIDDSSIRRACSLSDLSMGKGPKPSGPPLPSAQQKGSNASRQSTPARNSGKRSNSMVPKITTSTSNGMGSRSTSVGVLNQSDSETDTFQVSNSTRLGQSSNRINGTSSSSRAYGMKNTPPNSSRRKGLQNSYSSVNLLVTPHDDSSSEETPSSTTTNMKPILPPRPRNNANTAKMKEAFEILNKMEIENESANADLTSHLCANIIGTLNKTTNAVLQLHTRLKEESSETRNNNLMLKELENAVIMTQNMLTKIINNKTEKNSPESPCQKYEHKAYEAMAKIGDIMNQVKSINYKSSDIDEDEMKRNEK